MNNQKLYTDPYKGTRDFYPEDYAVQKYIFNIMRSVVEQYGYSEYNTPLIEYTSLYKAKSGEEIINEQTYSFTDRGGRDVTLRPETTPSVARLVAKKRKELSFPLRWYSIPNLFRYERPQKGRLREHWQLNVDIFGVESKSADEELIMVAKNIMNGFGAEDKDFEIKVNHRELINFILKEHFGLSDKQTYSAIKLIDRIRKVPADDFVKKMTEVTEKDADKIISIVKNTNLDDLPEKIQQSEAFIDLKSLIKNLKARGITNIVYDPSIMRGFDYYTGIVFEVFDTDKENNRSLFGGGRYDDLVTLFDVEKVTGAGFGMGDVTIYDFLQTHDLIPKKPEISINLYICILDKDSEDFVNELSDYLRNGGVSVFVDYSYRKVVNQIKTAQQRNSKFVTCIGADDVTKNEFTIKDFEDNKSKPMNRENLLEYILKK